MTLLLDANLSHRMVVELRKSFPGTSHVREHRLQAASDDEIWAFAREHGFVILSRDADFIEKSMLRGAPPKVVRVNCGNTSTAETLHYILNSRATIEFFISDAAQSHLELPPSDQLSEMH